MSGVIRSERGVSRLSSAEVKGTILSEQMDVAELSSLSLPLHFPFNSLSLPASELAKVELLSDDIRSWPFGVMLKITMVHKFVDHKLVYRC